MIGEVKGLQPEGRGVYGHFQQSGHKRCACYFSFLCQLTQRQWGANTLSTVHLLLTDATRQGRQFPFHNTTTRGPFHMTTTMRGCPPRQRFLFHTRQRGGQPLVVCFLSTRWWWGAVPLVIVCFLFTRWQWWGAVPLVSGFLPTHDSDEGLSSHHLFSFHTWHVRGCPPPRLFPFHTHNDDNEGLSPSLSVPFHMTMTRGCPPHCLFLSIWRWRGAVPLISFSSTHDEDKGLSPSLSVSFPHDGNDERAQLSPSSVSLPHMTTTRGCPLCRPSISFHDNNNKGLSL